MVLAPYHADVSIFVPRSPRYGRQIRAGSWAGGVALGATFHWAMLRALHCTSHPGGTWLLRLLRCFFFAARRPIPDPAYWERAIAAGAVPKRQSGDGYGAPPDRPTLRRTSHVLVRYIQTFVRTSRRSWLLSAAATDCGPPYLKGGVPAPGGKIVLAAAERAQPCGATAAGAPLRRLKEPGSDLRAHYLPHSTAQYSAVTRARPAQRRWGPLAEPGTGCTNPRMTTREGPSIPTYVVQPFSRRK